MNSELQELADLMFPDVTKTIEDYEKMYPERNLEEGARVTRFAPSPTGFVHMGSLLSAFESCKAAHDTKGVFYLRIEDTDQKRSVENGIEGILNDLKNFDIIPDEGMINEHESIGEYAPYIQSERKEIYHTFCKYLVLKGLAYPCFCTENELNETREIQELNKERIGYYGSFAKCRSLSVDDAIKKIKDGCEFVLDLVGFFEEKYKKKVEHLQKEGIVRFYGFQQDPKLFYAQADCVVLPSYHEGMNNVLLEAAATGRAIITTDIPGCREAVDNGKSGMLCRVKNTDSLYKAMKRFAELPRDKREAIGKIGRAKMEQEFDKRKVVEETVKAL